MTEPTLHEELRALAESLWPPGYFPKVGIANQILDILDRHPDTPATDKRIAELKSTLFNAQQALLTEGRARMVSDEKVVQLEAQMEAARVALTQVMRYASGEASGDSEDETEDHLLKTIYGIAEKGTALSTLPAPAWQEEARKLSDEWDKGYDCHVMMDPTSHLHAVALRDLVDRYCKGGV